MIAPLAKFIDWSALQFFWALRLRSLRTANNATSNFKLEEALQLLNGPDFLPTAGDPAKIKFSNSVHFQFPTPRPCDFAGNNIVYGRFYRCAKDWQERPAVILLHGGGDFLNHRYRFPLIVPACNRAGFNAATLVAPYHFQRRRRPPGAFDYLRHAEARSQGVAEIRALTGWLLAQGCPSVALWGISLGGWLAGSAACRDTRLASVVLTVPGVRLKSSTAVVRSRVRQLVQQRRAAYEMLNTTPLNLTLNRPVIPKENILLLEGTQDLFVGTDGIEELWQKWNQPEIWRLPHGHVSWMLAPGLTGRVLSWLAERANKPTPSASGVKMSIMSSST